MLHALVAAVCLSAGLAGPATTKPFGFELSSASVTGHGVSLRYTTTCPPGTAFYGLGVSIAQRTGAHVATASGTIREPCGRRPRSIVLRTGGVRFRHGAAYAQVWGCAGAGCFEVDPLLVVPVRFG
jgi:hypothetical protein